MQYWCVSICKFNKTTTEVILSLQSTGAKKSHVHEVDGELNLLALVDSDVPIDLTVVLVLLGKVGGGESTRVSTQVVFNSR